MVESKILEIVQIFYRLVRIHLQGIFVDFLNLARFRVLAQESEDLHGILHIIGAIDGSHIPILALVIGGEGYYCRKSFPLVLLQVIINIECVFWDYKFRWT